MRRKYSFIICSLCQYKNTQIQSLCSGVFWSNDPRQKGLKKKNRTTDLKGEFGAPKIGFLFLPEVVWFDDECHADLRREKLLQGLQQRFYQLPLGPTHVDDDGKATFTDILTGR